MTIVLALIALLGSVSSTAAQSAIPPVCSVGDTWKFSDGRVMTVTKVEDGWTSVTGSLRDCLTCVVRLDKDFNFDGTVQDASGNAVDVMKMRFVLDGLAWKFWDWPLEVGKQWRFTARSYFNQVSRKNDVASTVNAF